MWCIRSGGSIGSEGSGQANRSAAASWAAAPWPPGSHHNWTNRAMARARRQSRRTHDQASSSVRAASASSSVQSATHSTSIRASTSPSPRVRASSRRTCRSNGSHDVGMQPPPPRPRRVAAADRRRSPRPARPGRRAGRVRAAGGRGPACAGFPRTLPLPARPSAFPLDTRDACEVAGVYRGSAAVASGHLHNLAGRPVGSAAAVA